jgi:hypothetical protein
MPMASRGRLKLAHVRGEKWSDLRDADGIDVEDASFRVVSPRLNGTVRVSARCHCEC